MIKIKKIHSMQWGDESQNSVLLIADTNTGDFETISNATGGAAWSAGATSTDVSNNTGWLFANVPNGKMLLMFF